MNLKQIPGKFPKIIVWDKIRDYVDIRNTIFSHQSKCDELILLNYTNGIFILKLQICSLTVRLH